MEKMMTFEEWDKLSPFHFGTKSAEEYKRDLFQMARKGMIPAENAVVIPEWPNDKDIVGVVIGWDCNGPGCHLEEEGKDYYKLIKYIPRPKPVWVPKVGEAVFLNPIEAHKPIYVGIIEHPDCDDSEQFFARYGRNDRCYWYIDRIKPFHESHIGKPWDAIPGGGV